MNLNDGVVEGFRSLKAAAFSVQYHPEAAAGPHDAAYLFDRFLDLMSERSEEVEVRGAPAPSLETTEPNREGEI